jgi:hypothetical protein
MYLQAADAPAPKPSAVIEVIDTTLIDEASELTPEEVPVLAFLQRRLDTHAKGKAQ